MKCLVTGASSGIGRDICKYLSSLNYEIIMVSSNEKKLKEVSKEIKNSTIYVCDLSNQKEVDQFLKFINKERPSIVINNAGFGAFGFYDEVSMEKDINMINVNLITVHKITKTVIKYMEEDNFGYLLNVSSSASFMPGGPVLNTYYATKSYVKSYTLSIYEELKKRKSKVNVSVLCPGPVNTNFNNVAKGTFSVKGLSSEYVAKYAIDKMFLGKTIIIPGLSMKVLIFLSKFAPSKLLLNIMFLIQHKKYRKD